MKFAHCQQYKYVGRRGGGGGGGGGADDKFFQRAVSHSASGLVRYD